MLFSIKMLKVLKAIKSFNNYFKCVLENRLCSLLDDKMLVFHKKSKNPISNINTIYCQKFQRKTKF